MAPQDGAEQTLTNDLLGLSQLSLETLDIRKDPVDLRDVSATVTAALLGHAQRKHQHLKCCVKTDRATVCGDAAKLTQVLTNLVNNAIKYTPRDGHITITISAQEPGGNVLVAVSDTGIGIVADQMPELLDLFERGDPDRLAPLPEAGDGLGIGLWIAKRFVEAHGGTLTVTSAGPGLGSTFTIALPGVQVAGSRADM